MQKIFYLHVPLAIVALCGFVAGGVYGIRYLRSGDRLHDLRSYVAIHLSLILGVGALITGSIWARAAWGQWWVWDEPTLVSFLIVFLLYACYQPLRFSIEDPERQARYAAVFAVVGGAFVPLNFLAVRLAESLIHPRVLSTTGGSMPGSMRLTFLLSLAAHGYAGGDAVEVRAEPPSRRSIQLRSLRRRLAERRRRRLRPGPPQRGAPALMPALPLDDAGPYVAAAYLVFLALILVYVAIMAEQASCASSARSASWRSWSSGDAGRARARAPRRCPMSELLALGASHKTAPIAVRERIALLDGTRRGAARPSWSRSPSIAEAVALSTCNRTELYLVVSDPVEAESEVLVAARAPRGHPARPSWSRASTRCATATRRATSTAWRAAWSR